MLWALWRFLPQNRTADFVKLVVFVSLLAGVGTVAFLGRLPRTRPIVSDEVVLTDL